MFFAAAAATSASASACDMVPVTESTTAPPRMVIIVGKLLMRNSSEMPACLSTLILTSTTEGTGDAPVFVRSRRRLHHRVFQHRRQRLARPAPVRVKVKHERDVAHAESPPPAPAAAPLLDLHDALHLRLVRLRRRRRRRSRRGAAARRRTYALQLVNVASGDPPPSDVTRVRPDARAGPNTGPTRRAVPDRRGAAARGERARETEAPRPRIDAEARSFRQTRDERGG